MLGDFLHARFDQVEHLGVKVRTVPWISQDSGTTLVASPVWIMVTEITPASMGRLLRVMMVWKACTIWQATGTGSMPLCGSAACALAAGW